MRAFGDWPLGLRAVVAVAATSLFMVLVAWAALIGTDAVFTGPGPSPGPSTTATQSCTPLPERTGPDGTTTVVLPDDHAERDYCDPPAAGADDRREPVEQTPPPWVEALARVVLGALLVAVAAGVAWLVVAVARALLVRHADDERPEVEFTVLDEPARVAESVTRDAGEQEALLRDGEPRNAIVAAWHRFEVQGERAGVTRRASETSSEFAIRVLDLAAADTVSVNRLAELYREARFSEHPITEEHRAEALTALTAVRRSLEART